MTWVRCYVQHKTQSKFPKVVFHQSFYCHLTKYYIIVATNSNTFVSSNTYSTLVSCHPCLCVYMCLLCLPCVFTLPPLIVLFSSFLRMVISTHCFLFSLLSCYCTTFCVFFHSILLFHHNFIFFFKLNLHTSVAIL